MYTNMIIFTSRENQHFITSPRFLQLRHRVLSWSLTWLSRWAWDTVLLTGSSASLQKPQFRTLTPCSQSVCCDFVNFEPHPKLHLPLSCGPWPCHRLAGLQNFISQILKIPTLWSSHKYTSHCLHQRHCLENWLRLSRCLLPCHSWGRSLALQVHDVNQTAGLIVKYFFKENFSSTLKISTYIQTKYL